MENQSFDTQIICVDEDLKLSFATEELTGLVNGLVKSELFSGKIGEAYAVRTFAGINTPENTVFVGIGKKEESEDLFQIEKAFAKAISKAKEIKSTQIVAWLDERIDEDQTAKAIEAMHLAKYTFSKYKKDDAPKVPIISVSTPHSMQKKAEEAILIAAQTCVARDLVNEPSNAMYPDTLAEAAIAEGKEHGFDVEVLGVEEIAKLGMESFLSVAKGSDKEPKLIVMTYGGGGSETIGLVGKGLTYDSGGYSIKPTDSMLTMHGDMAGSAAVIAAMGAIAEMELKVNVVAVVAACENLISGRAYKPGDIIGTMNGKTIEILNTDAEGRLTLIDAITYIIREQNADKVIDVATLTGAAVVALGNEITFALSNNDELWEAVEFGAKKATEKIWRMPIDKDLEESYKPKMADLANSSSRDAGAIKAGMFVGEFVEDKPWVHLDIAGPSYADKDTPLSPVGGTGNCVRTLYHTVKKLSE